MADILLLDTSAAVPLLRRRDGAHDLVAERVRGHVLGLAGHAAFETFSVLTRMPPPDRVPAHAAIQSITRSFPATHHLSATSAGALLERLHDMALGGAVYDVLVAAAALEAEHLLISRDRCAAETYRRVGARFELI